MAWVLLIFLYWYIRRPEAQAGMCQFLANSVEKVLTFINSCQLGIDSEFMEREKTSMALRKPQSVDEELVELCRKMRLMSERDVDATLAQVLKTMMVAGRDRPVGGSELAKSSGINRITIIHHLRRLEGAGFVRREEGKYVMRVRSAEDMLMEFRREMEAAFSEMDELAREIDEQFSQMEKVAGEQERGRQKRLR